MSEPLLPLLRAYAAERRRILTEHPTPDELLDYYLEDGTSEQRERLQDHLALCPDCARAILDLAAFPDIAPAAGGEALPDKAAAWNRLRDQAFAVAPVIPHPSAFRRRTPTMSLIAASLLMATLSGVGGFYYGSQQSERAPEPFDWVVQGATERSGGIGDVEEIDVPASAGSVRLFLIPEVPQEFSSYDVEVTRMGRKPVFSRAGLPGYPKGLVKFDFDRELPSGVYTVRLYGVEGRERIPILQERIDIEWQGRRD